MTYALVIHGGAGARPGTDYTLHKKHLATLLEMGQEMLISGNTALQTVTTIVAEMETSGLYVAGKGAAPNTDGIIELDASVMDGKDKRAGAVAAMSDIKHPIHAALSVLQDGRHVMLAGNGARSFALANGAISINDPANYYTEHVKYGSTGEVGNHGTVGAVALDVTGNLAAETSTGGTFKKRPGRIGDTPLIGAGTWADDRVAVSGTGIGEAFIRSSAAHDVTARVTYGNATLDSATRAVLDQIKACDGNGGLIAVDRAGNISMQFNSDGMKRAAVSSTMPAVVRVFEPEPIQD